jgi:hypothetical protein
MFLGLGALPGRRIGQRWGATRAPCQGLHSQEGQATLPYPSWPLQAMQPDGDKPFRRP